MKHWLEKTKAVEREIYELFQQKDEKAVELIFDTYGAALYGMALRIASTEQQAKELLRQMISTIWRSSQQFDPTQSRLFSWMANISRQVALDAKHRDSRKGSRNPGSGEHIAYDPKYAGTSQPDLEWHSLEKVLRDLEDKHVKLLDYSLLRGASPEEAEETLNTPLGTARTRLRVALKEWRHLIGDELV